MADRENIRKACIAARNSLSTEDRAQKSAEIVAKLVDTAEYRKARTIMIYKAVKGEVRLQALEKYNADHGNEKIFVYPLCVSDTEMIALLPDGEDSWQTGYKDIPEPVRERSVPCDPGDIDLVICPCSSFDENLGRMGMGAGFYDRFLEKCVSADTVAVAFECQKSEDVMRQEWDKPMGAVVTEKKIYRKKYLNVVGAIIEYRGRILCMQRGLSKFASTSYKYEFPGGKIEPGETRPQALMRELREEMDFDIDISEDDFYGRIHHVYPDFEINIAFYLCHSKTDVFTRREHINHVWLKPEDLASLDWAEADCEIIEKLMKIGQF